MLRRFFKFRVVGASTRFDPFLKPPSAPLLRGSSASRRRRARCGGPRLALGAMAAALRCAHLVALSSDICCPGSLLARLARKPMELGSSVDSSRAVLKLVG